MRADRKRSLRRGSLSIELLFVFPLLLAVLLGTVEFSLWLIAQQQVVLASREGARAAATGGSATDVEQAVGRALGARAPAATVQANLTDANGQPVASGEPVRVLVQLPVATVVPDLLIFIGLSIRNETLVSQTVMRKE